jgi:GTP-binding protein HflX
MSTKPHTQPVAECHGCPLNLRDHCWIHADPRAEWQRRSGCPSRDDEALHKEFKQWVAAPNAGVPPEPRLRGSRKRPHPFTARRNADRRRLDRPERERVGRARPERAILVQLVCAGTHPAQAEASLGELSRLADTAGAEVVGSIVQRRAKPTALWYVGAGKLADIQRMAREREANVIIFDNDLRPAQVNALDTALTVKVIDRTELILQIFARRAQTEEAKIQVELAQLEHMRTRLPHERQPRFGGGIGMRGPGETPLARHRAAVARRVKTLKQQLERIRRRRETVRAKRDKPSICLVGYTNAGKSTLLNALSSADAYVDDRLFATLDTKTRLVHVAEDTDVLVCDTVGFIRHLPHRLVASFRSTLEVAAEADLLLVVADSADPGVEDQLAVVQETLTEIGADAVPRLLLLNKCDLQTDAERLAALRVRAEHPECLAISARTGRNLRSLKEAIASRVGQLTAIDGAGA